MGTVNILFVLELVSVEESKGLMGREYRRTGVWLQSLSLRLIKMNS